MDPALLKRIHSRNDLKEGKFFELAYTEDIHVRARHCDYAFLLFYSDNCRCVKLVHFNTGHKYPVIDELTENFSRFIAGEELNSFYGCMYALDTFKNMSLENAEIPSINSTKRVNFYTGYAPIDEVLALSSGVLLWTFQAVMLMRMVVDDMKYAKCILKDYRAARADIYNSTIHLKLHGIPILRLFDELQPSRGYLTSPNMQGAMSLFEIVNNHENLLKGKGDC